jgi:DNA processing protein
LAKPDVSLNMFEEKIIQNLSSEPIQIDKLAEISSMTTSDCLVYLLSLEFKGLVKQFPGKMFSLI